MEKEQNNNTRHNWKYLYLISMLFISTLLIANTISVKIISIGDFNVPAGIMVYPIAFIFGDILTEIYGFKATRKVIWWGFLCQGLMSLFFYLAVIIEPAPFWKLQEEFASVLGLVPRIIFAGFVAYLVGEYINAVVMSKLKVKTKGKRFWYRAILSSFFGQSVDSLLFNTIAFVGVFSLEQILIIAGSGVLLKLSYEIIALPMTTMVTNWLKKKEGAEVFDYEAEYRFI